MADHREGRMTPQEARAVIGLWQQRQTQRQDWPTVADVAEGLGISIPEAESLLHDVRAQSPTEASPAPEGHAVLFSPVIHGPVKTGPYLWRLTAGTAGLTGFFCLFLNRLL